MKAATGLLSATLLLPVSILTAQTTTPDEPEPVIELEALTVEGYAESYSEVQTDSATRLEVPLKEVPLSIQVLPRQLLADQGIIDVDEALKNVSGAAAIGGITSRPHYYAIRGFYNFNYRDGFRMPVDAYVGVNPFGLDKIEVLKGPSTILYGKGDPGGIVNFTSARPLTEFQGTVRATAGSEAYTRGDLDVTGPAGDMLAYRVIASYEDAGSYRDAVDSTTSYLNPSFSVFIGETSQLWVSYENAQLETVPDNGVLILADGSVPPFSGRSNFYGSREDVYEVDQHRFITEFETQISDTWKSRLSYAYDQGDVTDGSRLFNFIDAGPTGYLGLLPPDNVYRIRIEEAPEREANSLRWENHFDFATGSVEHQLLVAIDYRDESSTDTNTGVDHSLFNYVTGGVSPEFDLGFFTLPFGQGFFYDEDFVIEGSIEDFGIAVQDLIKVNDRFNVLLGLRWEENETVSERTGQQTLNAAFGAPPVSLDTGELRSTSDDFSPRLGLLYQANDRLSLYASYLTSFISPIPGRLTEAGEPLKPEQAAQLEVGLKAELMEGRVFLNAAAFMIEKQDAFVNFPTFTENIGKEEAAGFEFDIAGALTEDVQIVASFGYVEMEFAEADALLRGNTRAGVPQTTASVWTMFAPEEWDGFSLGVGLFHAGETWANFTNTVEFESLNTVDAMVAYDVGPWRFQANLNNLTDELGYAANGGFASGLDPNTNPLYGYPSNGFNFRLSAQLRF